MTGRPMPVPSDAERSDDRRTSLRHGCFLPATYRCRSWWLLSFAQEAVVCNISRHGVSLQTRRPQEVGTLLTIELSAPCAGAAVGRLQAKVVHTQRTPVLRDWVLGCALENELSEDEVQALIQ
jgi:hypothetical protein